MNSNCKEFELDDLMAVCAIPVGNISAASKDSPSNVLKPTLNASSYDFPLKYINEDVIVIGREKAVKAMMERDGGREVRVETPVGELIPIMKMTGKAKDTEGDSVAGRQHTVTVSCEVDDRDGAVWEHLLKLERTPSHLLLTFRNGTQAFVAATRDSYMFTVERDGAKTSVTFRIYDIMGIQLIT